jgi:hypothetical protein
MAAPIYSQAEAQFLIECDKGLVGNAFSQLVPARGNQYRLSCRIDLLTYGQEEGRFMFRLEVQVNERTEEAGISLLGNMDSRGWVGLARYEIQRMSHYNKEPCDRRTIRANVVHRHIYSEAAVRELHFWDSCAEELPEVPTGGSFGQIRERIMRRMLDDMKIELVDRDAADGLFVR